MKKEMDDMSKLEPIKNDDFGEKQEYKNTKYFNSKSIAFIIHSQMLDDIPGNLKNRFRNDKDKKKLICHHCLDCSAWVEIKKDLD